MLYFIYLHTHKGYKLGRVTYKHVEGWTEKREITQRAQDLSYYLKRKEELHVGGPMWLECRIK